MQRSLPDQDIQHHFWYINLSLRIYYLSSVVGVGLKKGRNVSILYISFSVEIENILTDFEANSLKMSME